MKISINMSEVKTAICEYLKNELSITYVNPDMIVFQNARSIEDMGFEVVLTSPSKTIKIIPDAVEENNAKSKNTSSSRETRVSRSKEENVETRKSNEEEENGELPDSRKDSAEPEREVKVQPAEGFIYKSNNSLIKENEGFIYKDDNSLTKENEETLAEEPNPSYKEKNKKEEEESEETKVEAITDDNPFSSVFSGLKF